MSKLMSYKALSVAVLAVVLALFMSAGASAGEKVWTSGTHGLNEHVIDLESNPNMETVRGKISEVTASGVYLDGVYFPLMGAKIVDEGFRPAEIKDLYVGLSVLILKNYGSVSKMLCFNLIRSTSSTPDRPNNDKGNAGNSGSKK